MIRKYSSYEQQPKNQQIKNIQAALNQTTDQMITQTENLLNLNKKLENQLTAFRNREAKEEAERRFQNVVCKMHKDNDKASN